MNVGFAYLEFDPEDRHSKHRQRTSTRNMVPRLRVIKLEDLQTEDASSLFPPLTTNLAEQTGYLDGAPYIPPEMVLQLIGKIRTGDIVEYEQVEQAELFPTVEIKGQKVPAAKGILFPSCKPLTVNGIPIADLKVRPSYAQLKRRLRGPKSQADHMNIASDAMMLLRNPPDNMPDWAKIELQRGIVTLRAVSVLAPIAKQSRLVSAGPKKSGKSSIMSFLMILSRYLYLDQNPDLNIVIVLLGERPEEITDTADMIEVDDVTSGLSDDPRLVIFSTALDDPPFAWVNVCKLAENYVRRRVEMGLPTMLFVDSLTRVGQGTVWANPGNGNTLPGGLTSEAIFEPRNFLALAGQYPTGGFVTFVATALTGGRFEDALYDPIGQTTNADLVFGNWGIRPSIDLAGDATSTRKVHLFCSDGHLALMSWIQRMIKESSDGKPVKPPEQLDRLIAFCQNAENRARNVWDFYARGLWTISQAKAFLARVKAGEQILKPGKKEDQFATIEEAEAKLKSAISISNGYLGDWQKACVWIELWGIQSTILPWIRRKLQYATQELAIAQKELTEWEKVIAQEVVEIVQNTDSPAQVVNSTQEDPAKMAQALSLQEAQEKVKKALEEWEIQQLSLAQFKPYARKWGIEMNETAVTIEVALPLES